MNFAAVGRVDIVEAAVDGLGEWTETVSDEVYDNSNRPNFQTLTAVPTFMPIPIQPTLVELTAAMGIRDKFALPGDPPDKHLGESETLAIIQSRFATNEAMLLTEDQGVILECTRRGLRTGGTRRVLEMAASSRYLSWVEADQVAQDILAAKRKVHNYPPVILQPMPSALMPRPVPPALETTFG